jgi:hypothetical protein
MEAAARNNPPFAVREKGMAVALLQAELVEQKIPMPKTMKKGSRTGTTAARRSPPSRRFSATTTSRRSMVSPARRSPVAHDPGAGVWNSKATEASYFALEQAIIQVLPVQGLAQEYDCKGPFNRRLTWKKGEAIPAVQLEAPGGR